MTESASAQVDATHVSPTDAPTFLEIIIDETGSMGSVKAATIAAFNKFISDQKEDPARCQVTMTKFHSSRTITPYEMVDLDMVPNLTANTFNPGDMTNLYDTIMTRIAILDDRIQDMKCNVLFLVLTDGADNASKMTALSVKSALKDKMAKGWTFVYLGAYQQALEAAIAMGFPPNNIKAFERNDVEMDSAFVETSNATKAFRSARSSGAVEVGTASMNYYAGVPNHE
jgi:hypothetical protein